MPIETPFSKLTALVVDDSTTQQGTLRGQLTSLGIQKVEVAGNPDDALRLAKSGKHNLVLCDYNLNHKTDGQQLLEYLRESEALSPDCLFFMVTAESTYTSVAAASEHKPDAYLLKPITAADVEERLRSSLERRKALTPITEALVRKDLPAALAACDATLARKDRWAMAALQHKGNLLLQLGRHADAAALYGAVRDQQPKLAWPRIGLGRALKAGGALDEARELAEALIGSADGNRNVAAYDLLADVFEAQGDTQAAQWTLRDAAVAVPSAKRQRLLAEAAFRNGDLATASEAMTKVSKATQGAITSQPQDVLTLAQTMTDLGQSVECLALLEKNKARFATTPQQESVAEAIRAQALARTGDTEGAARALARARETLRSPKADFGTVALARAELVAGSEEQGLKLLSVAVGADHESPRVKQLVQGALRATGHDDKVERLLAAASAALDQRVAKAKAMFRDNRIDDALAAIEEALKDVPENTGVLLQAAQMNCMALRLKKQANASAVERVRRYLARLDKLMPYNDRVAQMQRYFRETLFSLTEAAEAA
jgi:DNA-binding response OmpR family regulator